MLPEWPEPNPVYCEVRQVRIGDKPTSYIAMQENEHRAPLVLCMIVGRKRNEFQNIAAAAEWARAFRNARQETKTSVVVALLAALIPKLELDAKDAIADIRRHWTDCQLLWNEGVTVFERKAQREGGIPNFSAFKKHFAMFANAGFTNFSDLPKFDKASVINWMQLTAELSADPSSPFWVSQVSPLFEAYKKADLHDLDY
jgi:hypothetical protein